MAFLLLQCLHLCCRGVPAHGNHLLSDIIGVCNVSGLINYDTEITPNEPHDATDKRGAQRSFFFRDLVR